MSFFLNLFLLIHLIFILIFLQNVGDAIVIFFLKNVLIFSLIFWALLFLSSYFYKIKNQKSKRHFCECGFKALTDLNIQININFTMLCIFLILYDIEFTLLFPILFNIWNINILQYIFFILFLLLIVASLFYDWQTNSLSWQI
jgi:NADH:ubiquinone oxidoreductase subunit 3 (subunit A)